MPRTKTVRVSLPVPPAPPQDTDDPPVVPDLGATPDPEATRKRLMEILETAEGIREEHGVGADALRHMAALTRDLGADYIDGAMLATLPEFDVKALMEEAVQLDEHAHLRGRSFQVVFRRCAGKSGGKVMFGKGGANSKRDRALGAAWFRVTLALDVWCLLTLDERRRLVHHEMGHCAVDVDAQGHPRPKTVGHDVEEFAATWARYGLAGDEDSARAVAAVASHPETEATCRRYGFDPVTGQGVLFGGRPC